ncbi:MAG TPA: leucyl aminopeptidase [Chloroflexota bacterium]|nr:leucyl aminopeptidase [Chloroflexota bacterium]
MEINALAGRLPEAAADTLVVNLLQGVAHPGGATRAVDEALGGAISRLIASGDFTGKPNQTALLYPAADAAGVTATRVLLVGLGKGDDLTLDRVRQAAGTAARRARDLGARSVATVLHGAGAAGLSAGAAAQALAEGSLLAVHRFDELKGTGTGGAGGASEDGEDAGRHLQRLTVVELDEAKLPEIAAGLRRGVILAESAVFARDLTTRPGNILSPRVLAAAAEEMAGAAGLRCTVLGPEEIAELKMGALLGVAQGSAEPARFVVVEHALEDADGPPIVLCGKAITFDSGGISIKPSEGMWAMKDDMAGGAAVLGALRALSLLGVRRRAVALVASAENMPSGTAIRPGDVLRAMDGQTIEIISTDAEGRLVLADALAYGQRYSPAAMVDAATLTGGVITALGHGAAGVMGNDADVVNRLRAAGDATGERVWELPLWDDAYKRAIRSDIADMKNSGGRAASAIAGGMFLKQFARKTPWAHLDIAGMSWADADSPYRPKGATGYGVRLLAEFVAGYVAAD